MPITATTDKKAEMVPAQTTVKTDVELALLYGAQSENRTYAGQIRHILTSWAKQNPAPKGWVAPQN